MKDIRKRVVIEADIELVWSFVTQSEKIAMWLMPNDFKAKKGHAFTMQCQVKDGSQGHIEARVLELDPPQWLVYSWLIAEPRLQTQVSIRLSEVRGGTELNLVHSGWEPLGEDPAGLRALHDSIWSQLLEEKLRGLICGGERS